MKTAVLLLAHGTPDNVSEIPEYMRNVTGGRPIPELVSTAMRLSKRQPEWQSTSWIHGMIIPGSLKRSQIACRLLSRELAEGLSLSLQPTVFQREQFRREIPMSSKLKRRRHS